MVTMMRLKVNMIVKVCGEYGESRKELTRF